MTRSTYKTLHRTARLGNLGSLTFSAGEHYYWFLEEVYDIRFPHIGDSRHNVPRTFDPLQVSTRHRLAWKRQRTYLERVKFCARCHSVHHDQHDCL
jgi:hypothetical protein